MVRIKDGNYIAIFHDRMIEVKANEKHEAYEKAKRYFESREHRELFDGELTSPIFLNKSNSKKILKIVDDLLINNTIKYVSAPMNIIVEEGNKILCKGDDNDE